MNHTTARAVACALIVTLSLSAPALSSCGTNKKNLYTPPAPTETGMGIQENSITSFVTQNQKLLEDVAKSLTKEKGVSYYYFSGNGDKDSKVEKLVSENGTYVRRETRETLLIKLAKTRFVGEISHSDNKPEMVSFYTYMRNNRTGYYFVYCPTSDAVEYLSHDFLTGAVKVTVTHITGSWYYVEGE